MQSGAGIQPKFVHCQYPCFSWMLYKPPDEHLAIIFSEGYTLLSGVWQQEQRGVRVRYHTLYANVWGLDRSNPDREEVLDYAPVKEPGRLASWFRSSELQMKFVPLRRLDDVGGFGKVIEFHKAHPLPPPK